MYWLANGFNLLRLLIQLVVLGAGLVALIDAAFRPAPAFTAAGKLTKPGWLVILAVGFAWLFFAGVLNFIGPIALVAIIVYLVDVRPAVRALGGRRKRGSGSGSGSEPRW